MDILKNIWDFLGNALETILDFAVSALPPSPFQMIDNSVVAPYLGYFNWVFPINEVLATMEVWLVAIGLFYAVQALLRWTKSIE